MKKVDKTCYNSNQIKEIADFKKECDLYRLHYESTQNSLQLCLSDTQCSRSWTEDKLTVGAGFLATFFVGVIIGSNIRTR